MAKRGSKKRRSLKAPTKENILALWSEQSAPPMRLKEICVRLGHGPGAKAMIRPLIRELLDDGSLIRRKGGRYGPAITRETLSGVLRVNPAGFGFLLVEEGSDIYVPKDKMTGALNGDKVEVTISGRRSFSGSPSGRVSRIIEHANEKIVGVYLEQNGRCIVRPTDERIRTTITVDPPKNAKPGDLVLVETSWSPGRAGLDTGKITDVLGRAGEPAAEVLGIACGKQLAIRFDERVIREARIFGSEVPQAAYANRKDLRKRLLITIDGEDARDFDDAIGLERQGKNWLLTVAIADVSAYVKPDTALDEEAQARGNSVYFPNFCLPMLPEELSNGLCSLMPDVDRLTMSAEMEFDLTGKFIGAQLNRSVIRSFRRCTYKEVQRLFDGETDHGLPRPVTKMLADCRKLAKAMIKRRLKEGALDLDMPEMHVVLDEKLMPQDICRRTMSESTRIVEQFMVAANEAVASIMHSKERPLLYRVHESPPAENAATLSAFVKQYGIELDPETQLTPTMISALLAETKGKPFAKAVGEMILRSLAKATYSPHNKGHFGLASKYYGHFTSPIRRYPDLLVHRSLKKYLDSEVFDEEGKRQEIAYLETMGDHCSDTERKAAEAEREAARFFAALLMQGKIGESFLGTVSGVTDFGFFVELERYFLEGIVRLADLDGWYNFDPDRRVLVAEKSGHTIKIGDAVLINVADVKIAARSISFGLAEGPLSEKRLNKLRAKATGDQSPA
jgi:ribonuclease R